MNQALWARFRTAIKQSPRWLCFGLILTAACGPNSNDRNPPERIPPVPARMGTGPKDTVSGASRPQWTFANLEEALRKNGLCPIGAGPVRQPFLGAEGVLYRIGETELQAYLYADAGAVARDTDPLDTTRVAPSTMQISWRMQPTLIVDDKHGRHSADP